VKKRSGTRSAYAAAILPGAPRIVNMEKTTRFA
jgi:hypothetical protein